MAKKKKVISTKPKAEFSDDVNNTFVVNPENAVNPTSPVYQIQRDKAEGK